VNVLYQLAGLRMRLGQAEVLHGITLEIFAGQMVTVVGPNGAGKSTLLSVLSGFRGGYQGRCLFLGEEVNRWNKRALARRLAFVPQILRVEFPFTAEQVVFMGRTPHCHGLFESPADRQAVEHAMAITDTLEFSGRDFRALSGGEQQRVILAGALAQQSSVLLLDEPTTFLDLKHQIKTYSLLRDLCHQGMTVVAVTHDLNLAAAYADRIVVLSKGEVAADATPEQVLRPLLLLEVFGVRAQIGHGPAGKPSVLYGPSEITC